MSRPHRARALAVVTLALGAAACQDYNFNPVGHCFVNAGTQRFTLSSVSTADVLFVVDDSNSMAGEQAALARNFDSFVDNLTSTNAARQAGGLEPIDFHIAVTTSSVYWNGDFLPLGETCSTSCGVASGQPVCCKAGGSAPVLEPATCTGAADATSCAPYSGSSCRLDCSGFAGEYRCCNTNGTSTTSLVKYVPCTVVGGTCGSGWRTHYLFESGCTTPIAKDLWPFPDGDFVGSTNWAGTTGTNPRVLHFDKSLYDPTDAHYPNNLQGFSQSQLVGWFRQNVQVGTCGSGQEQLLQGGLHALDKAFGGRQRDTRDASGNVVWTPPTATALPTTTAARWPNPNSKLVMVFVGDEDDCSAPANPSGADVMLAGEGPGMTLTDACSRDATDPLPYGHKQYPVDHFVSAFLGLGRPIAAGFILPAAQDSCTLASCTAAPLADGGSLCCAGGACTSTEGAQAPGTRLLATAKKLAEAGVEVVAGSICDPNFGTILNDIAEIVKPPETLELPSIPAEGRIALLRIIGGNGDARLCRAALPPAGIADLAAAKATHADWWFVAKKEPGPPAFDPGTCSSTAVPCPTSYVYINPDGACKANPGETYSADFIGVSPPPTASNPAGGCVVTPTTTTSPAPDGDCDGVGDCVATGGAAVRSVDCQAKLGARATDWLCFTPPGLTRGTCTCKSSQ